LALCFSNLGLEAVYLGCYKDTGTRDLVVAKPDQNSIKACNTACVGYTYFGVQDGKQCFCGERYGTYGKAPESDCQSKCGDNPKQNCGGFWRNSVYEVDNIKPTYKYVGCYKDDANRDLVVMKMGQQATVGACYAACKGYTYFGVQEGEQCFCGDRYDTYGQVPETDCQMGCEVKPDQICGGFWRNSIYVDTEVLALSKYPLKYLGCFKDTATRDLELQKQDQQATIISCRYLCQGYTYFGLQAGGQCFCGNRVGLYGKVDGSECQSKCDADTAQICGGFWRNSVYTVNAPKEDNNQR